MSGRAGTRLINKIIVHCSDSEFGNMKRLRLWHTTGEGNGKGRGWSDVGYHYSIANGKVFKNDTRNEHIQDGYIEEGRPLAKAGAHCKGQNSNSIGICLIGKKIFTDKQFDSMYRLIKGLLVQFDLGEEDIYGHYEFSDKTCPNFNPLEIYEQYKEE